MKRFIFSFLCLGCFSLFSANASCFFNDSVLTQEDSIQSELSYEDKTLIDLFLSYVSRRDSEWALSIWDEIGFKDRADLQHAYLRAIEGTGQTEGLIKKYEDLTVAYPQYTTGHEALLFLKAKALFDSTERKCNNLCLFKTRIKGFNR